MTARLVLTTAPNAEVAQTLATGLVEASLAACVNILPGVRSVYRWQGNIEVDEELQLFIKTDAALHDALVAWLGEHHPYDVPEVLAFDVTDGSAGYLAWLAASLKRSS